METTNQSTSQGIREGRIQKLTDLVDMGVNPYPYTFDKTANAQTLQEKYKDKKVLLVTHGGTTRAIETFFYGVDENGIMPPETIKNCEIREYEYKD